MAIGILAFGSLIADPGRKISLLIAQRVPIQTPFSVEFARWSKTRGNAATLVPHPSGIPVAAEILVLRDGVSLEDARDMLWRRETRREGSGDKYVRGNTASSVLVETLENFGGIGCVIYTDFSDQGKMAEPDPIELANRAVVSVEKAKTGTDGISYLIQVINSGIRTRLTNEYIAEILRMTGAGSLEQSLSWLQGNRMYEHAKRVLHENARLPADENGYVQWPQENLIPGIELNQFEQDLRQGAGHELRMKFCAVHSSSALAVNTFALFKDRPADLALLGQSGFGPPSFEKELGTGLHGTPPTLDVFLQKGPEVVAIESKFLEYFTPTQAEFADSYTRDALPWAEDCWWRVLQDAPNAGKRNLDVAQLVKHYLGLSRMVHEGTVTPATLLYLFWEPENASELAICHQHRTEIEDLVKRVAGSVVAFKWMSYPELWEEWIAIPALAEHAENLKRRYEVSL